MMESLRRHLRFSGRLDFVMIGILVLSGFALLYRLADPEGSLIFDETYYVQMARVILGWPTYPYNLPENLLSGCDPNSEHPPLAKLIMAGGMLIFGEDGHGWRLPSVLLGLQGTLMVYLITRQLGGSRFQARLAALVLAFDNLYFIHSRIATLDIYMVSFSLLGVWLYLRGWHEIAALSFGLATVCKINGLLWVGGMFLYECGLYLQARFPTEEGPRPARSWTPFLTTLAIYLPFTYLTLGWMDCYYTEFRGPLEHVAHIFSYGTSLSRAPGVETQGAESTPLQWWLNRKEFEYLGLTGSQNDLVTTIASFKGCMSIYLIAVAPFVLAGNWIRARRGDRLALLVICLFVANYVPMLLTWLKVRRISYIFYMLPSLPAFAIGTAHLCERLPRWVGWMFALLTLYSFLSLFPFPLF